MGSKYKPRQQHKARSFVALDAIINHKGGYMKHRTERRAKERDDVRNYLEEWDEPMIQVRERE